MHEHCKPVYRSPVFGPGLVPGLDDYHHESGATYRLLRLSGTLPIAYRQTQYNIPIELWLPHDYPHVAPLLYVRPTAQMVIKQTAAVDASGKFAMNDAQRTVFGDEALVEVLKAAQKAFALDPPVYSRTSATAVTAATTSLGVSPAVSSTSINAGQSFQQTGYPQQQQQMYQQQPQYGYNTAASTSSPYAGYSPPQQQQFYAQQQYAQLPYAQQQMHYAQQQQQHQQQAYAYGNAYTQNQQTGSGTYHPGASNMISPQVGCIM